MRLDVFHNPPVPLAQALAHEVEPADHILHFVWLLVRLFDALHGDFPSLAREYPMQLYPIAGDFASEGLGYCIISMCNIQGHAVSFAIHHNGASLNRQLFHIRKNGGPLG